VHRIFRAQLHDKKHYDERMTVIPEEHSKMEYTITSVPLMADILDI
jgi:isocitrate lyase